MWSFLLSFFSGGIGTIFTGITGLWKTIFGDKSAQQGYDSQAKLATIQAQAQADAALSEEQIALQKSYEAEFSAPEKVHFFGRFVDNANRLVRPMFTYGIMALFVYAVVDSTGFARSMLALTAIPDMLWNIMITIIAFWFGSRMLEKAPIGIKASSLPAAVPGTKIQQVAPTPMPDLVFNKAMTDTSKPLSNSVIDEWNRRNNPNFSTVPTNTSLPDQK